MRSREEIYTDIQEERPYILRHCITPRVWETMNKLLDELVEIQHEEALELLENPEEVGYGQS